MFPRNPAQAFFGPTPAEFGWLRFQCGPVQDVGGRNGVFVEEVLEVVLRRLRDLNTKFPCRENSIAITNIEQGLMWLNERTRLRTEQGVEGKDIPHTS